MQAADTHIDAQKGSTPIPDPTVLTTQQLVREITALKEIIFTRLDAMDRAIVIFNEAITRTPTDTDKQISHLKSLHEARFGEVATEMKMAHDIVFTRFESVDNAVIANQTSIDKLPARMDEKISAIKNWIEEKFSSVGKQFYERDTREAQTRLENKTSVDAALQAAKEAVGEQNKSSSLAITKSETATDKRLDQLQQLIQSTVKAIDDKFSDTKDRLTRIEGMREGKQTFGSNILAIVIASIAFAGLIISLMLKK